MSDSTGHVLRRAFKVSPALSKGLGWTLALAVFGTALQLVVPITVQRIIDSVLLANDVDTQDVLSAGAVALIAIVVAWWARRTSLARLARSSITGLTDLRVTTFEYLHKLSMLHVQAERRGALRQPRHLGYRDDAAVHGVGRCRNDPRSSSDHAGCCRDGGVRVASGADDRRRGSPVFADADLVSADSATRPRPGPRAGCGLSLGCRRGDCRSSHGSSIWHGIFGPRQSEHRSRPAVSSRIRGGCARCRVVLLRRVVCGRDHGFGGCRRNRLRDLLGSQRRNAGCVPLPRNTAG